MTYISVISKTFRVKFTDHVNELSEELGFDIADKPFRADENGIRNGKVRGYVRMPLTPVTSIDKGPITLNTDDLEEIK